MDERVRGTVCLYGRPEGRYTFACRAALVLSRGLPVCLMLAKGEISARTFTSSHELRSHWRSSARSPSSAYRGALAGSIGFRMLAISVCQGAKTCRSTCLSPSRPTGQHIEYISPHFFIATVLTLYLLSTATSMLFSTRPSVRTFGVLALVAFSAAYAFYATWFISVWCFFAAVLSAVVYLHFRAHANSLKEARS